MIFRTDRSIGYREISTRFVASLGASALLVIAYSLWHTTQYGYPYGIFPEITLPAILVSGWSVEQELISFSRGTSQSMGPEYFSALGVSMLLFFVVGPILLTVAIRRRVLGHPPVLPDVITVSGIVTGLSWMLTAGGFVAFQPPMMHRLMDSHRIHRTSDKVISQLAEIGSDAAIFASLPESKGGGGGSLRTYRLPTHLRTPRIADFELEHVGSDIRVRGIIRADAWLFWGDPVKGAPNHASISATIRADGTIVGWKREGI